MVMRKDSLIRTLVLMVIGLIVFGPGPHSFAQQQDANEPEDLFEMSLEQLMAVEVTSVSKKEETLFKAAGAIHVITQEDIRRSGATSIPEALRMVPGLQVVRINSHTWGISIRGFNKQFADKLLVLIDGRSVYTLEFGGVYWDMHDVMLEDVERIEVIRGPGGTLWGSNAVNGIINIITKRAEDTQGTLLSGGGGSEEQGFGAVRYGGKLSDKSYYRVYSKYFNRDDSPTVFGSDSADQWNVFQGGFRIDTDISEADSLTLQSDIFDGQFSETGTLYSLSFPFSQSFSRRSDIRGGNILGRWKRIFSEDSDMILQMYYDHTKRIEGTFKATCDVYDIDFQHRFLFGDIHEIIWGLGHRFYTDNTEGTFSFSLDPNSQDIHIYSGFFQDRITLIEDKLKLILGSKFEHHTFAGFECQPSGRLLWTHNELNTVWAAVSRAVRTPSRFDHGSSNVWAVYGGPTALIAFGNDDFESEEVTAYELGYRTQVANNLLLDFATFLNIYDNLMTHEVGSSRFETSPPHTVLPRLMDNKMDGETYGTEIAAIWGVTPDWKLNAGYSFLQIQLHPDSSSTDTSTDSTEENRSPHNQFHLRSYLDLSEDVELDLALNYVDSLSSIDVPSYLRLDARLGWHITKNMELSIAAQNLLDRRHPEFGGWGSTGVTEAERSYYIKLTWRF